LRKLIVAISRALVGKTLDQAKVIAAQNDAEVRVVEIDDQPLDIDLYGHQKNRVNVATANGRITRILGIG
jgi:hypothetical protein